MYIPITSEVTIEIGMVFRQISTGHLFEVVTRIQPAAEVAGEDIWKIMPIGLDNPQRMPVVLTRQELSEAYFAEVER